jgi:hypothetical protein
MLCTFIKRFDFYGQNLSIKFQKKSTHQTLPGGIISLLITVVILLYSTEKIVQCARRNEPTITSMQKLLNKKATYVDLEGSGFEIIVGFHDQKNLKKIKKLPSGIG